MQPSSEKNHRGSTFGLRPAQLGEHLDQGKVLGGPTPWKWHKDAEGKTCAYVSVDATGVRQQACGGGPAEGRMPYVGTIYNAVPELPKGSPHAPPAGATMQARYVAGLYSLDELSAVMRRQGAQVGIDRADRWIGFTDGGNGLEPFVQRSFPRVEVVIIDFWHVSDHLGDLARRHDDAARLYGSRQPCRQSEGNGQTVRHADHDVSELLRGGEVLFDVWCLWHAVS